MHDVHARHLHFVNFMFSKNNSQHYNATIKIHVSKMHISQNSGKPIPLICSDIKTEINAKPVFLCISHILKVQPGLLMITIKIHTGTNLSAAS